MVVIVTQGLEKVFVGQFSQHVMSLVLVYKQKQRHDEDQKLTLNFNIGDGQGPLRFYEHVRSIAGDHRRIQ